MFFLCDAIGQKVRFKTIGELKGYIETRHTEEGGFDWISTIKMAVGGVWKLN